MHLHVTMWSQTSTAGWHTAAIYHFIRIALQIFYTYIVVKHNRIYEKHPPTVNLLPTTIHSDVAAKYIKLPTQTYVEVQYQLPR